MKVSYNWLQTYFDTPLPSPEAVGEKLTFHAFEIDGVEKVGEDFVIDVDVLPNRAHDCLSHRGIAKELSVILDIPFKKDVLRTELGKVGAGLPQSKILSVEVDNARLCRRYTSAVIQGVKVGPSPVWLQKSLETLGQKSINNVVDATNYVMFGLGQPLHAFDASRLKQANGKFLIHVRSAKRGEKITVLTGEEYVLTQDDLLIVDGNADTPIGIAGIKGGLAAHVDETTTDIIIESANFHPINTRKTSQSIKVRTDASARFENELASEMALYGLTEVVALIQEIAGGAVEGYVDVYPLQRSMQYKAGVSINEINGLLGTQIVAKDVENILNRFGFSYEKVSPIEKVLACVATLIGVPYKYGASISYDAPHAFDCSSFVGYAFAQAGVGLPRMAIDQYVYGKEITEADLQPGDIIFSRSNPEDRKELTFNLLADGTEVTHKGPQTRSQEFLSGTEVVDGVSHNGIYLGAGKVMHASQEGVIEELYKESSYFSDVVGFRRMSNADERYVVAVPFERLDLHAHTSFLVSGNKEDLIEEIARIYGYTNIGEVTPWRKGDVPVHKKYYYAEKIRDFLTQRGFTEVYTYSLRDNGELELENPFASDKNFFRVNLRDGVSSSITLNEKNSAVLGLDTVKVFEIGDVFKDNKEQTAVCIGVSKKDAVTEAHIKELFKELEVVERGRH
ncbi:MAG: phenylalanine--tRNA ligase beta subunit-related protein [Candidatus Paceibacterota bacterium]